MKVDPDAAGFDATRLERITDHIQQRYLVHEKIAGCQVAVARNGSVAYFRNFGSMDLERGKPTADDTIWRIYSMTKPITGVALMSLYEKGHFQLSDPVHRFIPEWKDLKVRETDANGESRLVEPRRAMSVRDLMMHMSGLGFGGARPDAEPATAPAEGGGLDMLAALTAGRDGMTLETMCSRLAERPLRFHPGTQWLYTISTDICGRLVEVMSGQRFDEYLQSEIFDPLGMTDTGFWVDQSKADRVTKMHTYGDDKKIRTAPTQADPTRKPIFMSGGGGLLSTTGDYLKFAQMVLNGGQSNGKRFLKASTVELMRTNALEPGVVVDLYGPTYNINGIGFGLDFAIIMDPAKANTPEGKNSFYWGGAFGTWFWLDPTNDVVVVGMIQNLDGSRPDRGSPQVRPLSRKLVYDALVDPKK